jgi:hypothetical protein
MIKRVLLISIITFVNLVVHAQKEFYERVFLHIEKMLSEKTELNF